MPSASRAFASRRRISSRVFRTAAKNFRTAFDPVEGGREWNDLGFPILARNGAQNLPQLFRIHVKAWQSGHTKQADVIASGNDGVEAGEQIASLGCVRNIHALDDEGNVGFRKFVHNLVALVVRAVEDTEVRPLAPRLLLRIADIAGEIGAFGVFTGKNDHGNGRALKVHAGFDGILFAGGLQRRSGITERATLVVGKDGWIFVDQSECAAENGSRRTTVLFEHHPLCGREVTMEQAEGGAGCSAETIDSLVGVSDDEQVPSRAGEASENFDLGKVGVLKFVREDEAGTGTSLSQDTFVAV